MWGDVVCLIKPCSTANQLEFYMILVQYTSYSVNITSWPVIGAANMAAHCLFKKLTIFPFLSIVTTNIIGAVDTVPPIGKELQTGSTNNHISRIFLILAAPIYWWDKVNNTNVLVQFQC
jgi:hypothetical protein